MTQTTTPLFSRGPTKGTTPVLTVENLSVRYAAREVLHGISLDVDAGEVVGLIGESGSGKTTMARAVLGTVPTSGGRLTVDGQQTTGSTARQRLRFRREGHVQYVFQDPLGSLDSRFTALQAVRQGARETFGKQAADAQARGAMQAVQLAETLWNRRPGALSGGQRQRVAIARALAVKPALLVCDEPVSALDASSRIEVVRTLQTTARAGTGMLVISHDLSSLAAIADRILVLHEGTIVEAGATAQVLGAPQHPYTRRLIDAIPTIERASGLTPSSDHIPEKLPNGNTARELRVTGETAPGGASRHVNSPTGSIYLSTTPSPGQAAADRSYPLWRQVDGAEAPSTIHPNHRVEPAAV